MRKWEGGEKGTEEAARRVKGDMRRLEGGREGEKGRDASEAVRDIPGSHVASLHHVLTQATGVHTASVCGAAFGVEREYRVAVR